MRTRARVLGTAIALFGILVVLAVLAYHGGSHLDPFAGSYAFRTNYLSDLGRVLTYDGRTNALPRALFASATVLVGGALAWSAPAWRAWNGSGRAATATDVTVMSAVLAGAGFAAVGLVPEDRQLGPHTFVVDVAFGMLLVFVAALTVVQVRNRAPRVLWIANAGALAVLAVYAGFVLGSGTDTPSALTFAIVTQKFAVGIALLDVAVQTRGLAAKSATTDIGSRRGIGGVVET